MALRGTLTHWKTRKLAADLGISAAHALGLLEALWHTTAEDAPAGNIGRLSNEAIAMQMFTDIEPARLVRALVASGHLDEHPEHRLLVHDWHEHADYNVKRKVARYGGSMYTVNGNVPPIAKHDASQSVGDRIPEPVPEPEPAPEPEPEPEPGKGKARCARSRPRPKTEREALSTLATEILRECKLSTGPSDVRAVAEQINYEAPERGGTLEAAEFIKSKALAAIERGEPVTVFWFKDRKFEKREKMDVYKAFLLDDSNDDGEKAGA